MFHRDASSDVISSAVIPIGGVIAINGEKTNPCLFPDIALIISSFFFYSFSKSFFLLLFGS